MSTATSETQQLPIPAHLNREQKKAIECAVMVGWTLRVDRTGLAATLWSPDGQHQIHLGRRKPVPPKRMWSQIIRWADPVAIRAVADTKNVPDEFIALLPVVGDPGTVEVHEEEEDDDGTYAVRQIEEPDLEVEQAITEMTKPISTTHDETRSFREGTHLVSVRPMIARKNGKTGYESETTNVRTLADLVAGLRQKEEG